MRAKFQLMSYASPNDIAARSFLLAFGLMAFDFL